MTRGHRIDTAGHRPGKARTRSLRVARIVFLGAGICGGAAVAGTPEIFVALEYGVVSAAGTCPTAVVFRRNVARQLGYDPFRSDADRHVSVQITRSTGRLEGRLKWSDAEEQWVGDRKFSSRGADCAGLAASMMFSAAVQIQLLASLSPPPAPSPAVAPRPSAAVATPAVEPTSRPDAPIPRPSARDEDAPVPRPTAPPKDAPVPLPSSPAEKREDREASPSANASEPARDPASPPPIGARVAFAAGIGAALAIGVVPGIGTLGRIFLDARRGRLSLGLGANLTLPVNEQRPDGSAFALDTQAANAIACGHLGVLAGCVVGRFGRIHARGSGVDVPRSPSGLFSQVGVRLTAAHDVGGRYFAGAHVDGLIMLTPWTVALNKGAVWTTPRFCLLLGIDVGARFF